MRIPVRNDLYYDAYSYTTSKAVLTYANKDIIPEGTPYKGDPILYILVAL